MKLWCQVPFTKYKTIFQIEMYCMQCFLKSKYFKSRTFNDKNRWIIKKVMVLEKLLPHLATRGTFSPRDWRFDEAWREQTLMYPPVMCQQRLIYCTWELDVMYVILCFDTTQMFVSEGIRAVNSEAMLLHSMQISLQVSRYWLVIWLVAMENVLLTHCMCIFWEHVSIINHRISRKWRKVCKCQQF